jgi:hypothetical protein
MFLYGYETRPQDRKQYTNADKDPFCRPIFTGYGSIA